jgi:DNA-binding protein HU-beta
MPTEKHSLSGTVGANHAAPSSCPECRPVADAMDNAMTKTELIDAIAAGVEGLTKAKAEQTLNATSAAVMDAVGKGDTLTLVGFGTFSQGERGERVARNPHTGEEITVAAAKTVKFKAGQKFKDAVNG